MKRLLLLLILLPLFTPESNGQQAYRIKKRSNYNNPELPKVDGTDIWNDLTGWHDPRNNKEYIIAGSTDSIYFFDITNPDSMVLLQVRGGGSVYAKNRDFEVYDHYVYCVSDQAFGAGALQVFDLNFLPDSVHEVYHSDVLGKFTHTVFIDKPSKRLYMPMNSKASGFSALDVLSLDNPEQPSFLMKLDVPQKPGGGFLFSRVHEMYARNDTAYLSCEDAGLFIFDLRNPNQQQLIGSITSYPDRGYNHSSWLDSSGRYLMFTDENMGLDIKIYDLKNMSDPVFVSQFNSSTLAMPHNAYWLNDFAWVSSYHDGVVVYNIRNPANPEKVAWFDTHYEVPELYGGYKGCWGVYPYLPSGNIIASDLTTGIWVLTPEKDLLSAPKIQSEQLTIQLYPNPTSSQLTIQGLPISSEKTKVFVWSVLGNLVMQTELEPHQTQFQLPNLHEGIFILHMQTEKGLVVKRFQIKHP